MDARCRIYLFGELCVEQGERTITRFRTHKAASLLAYLALHLHQTHSREHLVDLFWPDMDLDTGRDNLSTALSALRRQLEPTGVPAGSLLVADRQTLRLNPQAVTTDAQDFERLLRSAQRASTSSERASLLEQALTLYRGELLPGCYDDWAVREQARFEGLVAEARETWEDLRDRRGEEETGRGREGGRALPSLPCVVAEERSQRTAGMTPSLPLQLTRFFGRDEEIARLCDLLSPASSSVRLVTLLGPGGAGKTRLSLEVAGRLAEAFGGRVWFVPLADLPAPSLILFALTNALKLPLVPGSDPLEQVAGYLGESPSLLALDNLEHLLAEKSPGKSENPGQTGAQEVVRRLLECVPALKCLVTSRQALLLGGEQEFLLPPLPLPERDEAPERLMAYGSVALYVDRAQSARPDFAVTAQNAAAVARLCQKLEGMPLAIEMAAAWAKTIPPARMLERLERQLDLLVSRRRDLPARHQSLRATIEWSYGLLEAELQACFRGLSVFRGGWTLEAAEAVCGPEALEALAQLQERSLVGMEEREGEEPRYRMLEALREFAAEKLTEAGEEADLQRRHRDYFFRQVEKVRLGRRGAEEAETITWLEADYDNIREALRRCSQDPDGAEDGLRIAESLWRFWDMRGYIREGLETLLRLLERTEPQGPTLTRAKALSAAGHLHQTLGDYPRAEAMHSQALTIARAMDDKETVASTLNGLAIAVYDQGKVELSRTLWEECLAVARAAGWERGICVVLCNLGELAYDLGDLVTARPLLEESLALARASGNQETIAHRLRLLGKMTHRLGDLVSAKAYTAESLKIQREVGHKIGVVETVEAYAGLAATQGDAALAARLLGAATALRKKINAILPPNERAEIEQWSDLTCAALGKEGFERAWKAGGEMTWEQAAEYALEQEGKA